MKPIERVRLISKFGKIKRFLNWKKFNFRDCQTKVCLYQKRIADFIKERRTVKLLGVLRNYSAMAVVISSAALVSSTNLASGKGSSGFLFGYWDNKADSIPKISRVDSQMIRKSDLAFVPLAKSSAISAPTEIKEEEYVVGQVMLNEESYLSTNNNILRDPEEDGGVKMYVVEEGDTISAIATKNGITVNTILWANDIDNVDSIKPGDKIFILPVAGLSYTVQKNDNLDYIAKKYKADKEKIIAFNDLPADGRLEEGEVIIIPGGEKEVPRSDSQNGVIQRREYATPLGGQPSVSGWKKLDGKAGAGHKFPYGYCTWYVAQRRYVPWGGNAGTWLYHAKIGGYKTGKSPQVGAIMVSSESWWGHVAIVEKVSGGTITISEMNYKGWGKKSSRTIAANSRVIKGYIY